jgi:hypothetical protein
LCGKSEAEVRMTNDHVPPRGFFKKPYKKLIEVDCCHACNNGHSNGDRIIRNLLTLLVGSGVDRDYVFKEKALKDLKRGDKKTLERIAAEMRYESVEIKGARFYTQTIKISDAEKAMISTFMIRVTKGLLRALCPEYDYSNDVFRCSMVKPGGVREEALAMKIPPVIDKRGNDAFYSFRFIDPELKGGMWLLTFYLGQTFKVLHLKEDLVDAD